MDWDWMVENSRNFATFVVSVAAVLTALGVIYKKSKESARVLRSKLAHEISDVVFDHPSFKRIYGDVYALREQVDYVTLEVKPNGGSSIKDQVGAIRKDAGEFSIRLGNVEKQVERLLLIREHEQQEGRRNASPLTDDYGNEF